MNEKLKYVCEKDARFILSLRLNQNLSKHLSSTDNDLNKQIEWIKNYKIREKQNKEYYFIIEGKNKEQYGTIRIYDLKEDSFCWGSWIIKPNSPYSVSITSALLLYEYAFYELGFKRSHFDVRKENQKVIDFHKRMGAKVVGEDELNYYFNFTINDYEKIKPKYKKFLI